MAVCPFMCGWIYNSDTKEIVFQQKDCIQSSCALWDEENNRCGAKVSDYSKKTLQIFYEDRNESGIAITDRLRELYRLLHEDGDETKRTITDILLKILLSLHEGDSESLRSLGKMLSSLLSCVHEDNDESKRSIGQLITEVKKLLHEENNETKRTITDVAVKTLQTLYEDRDENGVAVTDRVLDIHNHIHEVIEPLVINTNKHTKSIDYHITRIDERSNSATVSYAAILAQEFIQGEDFDGNGMIYGRDFKLENPPPILKALEKNTEWKEPSKILSIEEYKEGLSESIEDIISWVYGEYKSLRT
jgi:uncharacterized protein YicC (UPF0701 family)